MSKAASRERLFLIVNPQTGRIADTCAGPDEQGDCPRRYGPLVPCEGCRVIPMSGTLANGLPFSVEKRSWDECPMSWLTLP